VCVCVSVSVYISDCVETVDVLSFLPNKTASEDIFTQIGRSAKC